MIIIKNKVLLFKVIIVTSFLILGIYIGINYYKYHQEYQNKYDLLTNKIIEGSTAPRGRILDCNGNIIVDNISINSLVFHYVDGIDKVSVSKKLAGLFDFPLAQEKDLLNYYKAVFDENDLLTESEKQQAENRKLSRNEIGIIINERILQTYSFSDFEKECASVYAIINAGFSFTPKTIIKELSDAQVAKILDKNIEGISVESSFKRYYPYNDTLKGILGTVGNISKENKDEYLSKGYELDDEVGLSYLEKYYDDYLKGTKATYKVNSDNSLTKLTDSKRGNDLYLSIDINKQLAMEKIVEDNISIAKKRANTNYLTDSYAILSNPQTGAIVAMVGKRYLKEDEFKDVIGNNITSSFTLGSVVKGATISVGFKYNLIDPYQKILDSCVKLHSLTQKCSHDHLGRINAVEALAQSSNYYQFLIAIKLAGYEYKPDMIMNVSNKEFEIYRNMLASYGLGIKTGIDLPNEKIGLIGQTVSPDLLLNLAIGQYDTYTPIELATYINTLALDGNRKKPSLVEKIVDLDGETIYINDYETVANVDITQDNIDIIKNGLTAVMNNGTGWGSFNKNLNPAGKTGTSESFLDSDNDGIIDTSTITLTIGGFFPVNNPQYSLIVISPHASYDNPKHEYTYYVSAHISRDITNYIYETEFLSNS